MCNNPDCDSETQQALNEVLLAIDGSVNALVMARIILERHLPEIPGEPEPVDNEVHIPLSGEVATQTVPLVDYDPDGPCRHTNTFPITTGAGTVSMCHACGETL